MLSRTLFFSSFFFFWRGFLSERSIYSLSIISRNKKRLTSCRMMLYLVLKRCITGYVVVIYLLWQLFREIYFYSAGFLLFPSFLAVVTTETLVRKFYRFSFFVGVSHSLFLYRSVHLVMPHVQSVSNIQKHWYMDELFSILPLMRTHQVGKESRNCSNYRCNGFYRVSLAKFSFPSRDIKTFDDECGANTEESGENAGDKWSGMNGRNDPKKWRKIRKFEEVRRKE